jgi:tellurite methyltransferase
MNEDRQRWDQRHAAEHGPEGASLFLQEIFNIGAWSIQPGKALDIATDKGRNALYLAERGFRVEGIDISGVALEEARKRAEAKGLSIAFTQADLETFEFIDSYDLIVNINFLQRSLIPRLKNALKLGGHIVFETYLIEQRLIGHPKILPTSWGITSFWAFSRTSASFVTGKENLPRMAGNLTGRA